MRRAGSFLNLTGLNPIGLSLVLSLPTLSLALSLALSGSAFAAESLGSYRDWRAWVDGVGSGKVCYVASNPKRSEGDYTRRGEVFALVSYRPGGAAGSTSGGTAGGTGGEVSLVAGYRHAANSEVKIRIGSARFVLFTHDEASWARDREMDARIISAMREASQMAVEGTSERGTLTRDSYSLLGFTAALDAAAKACGV
ncbi:MAG: invasion associated locus B family protein [Alphaproteobacteria bacterium]